jgi:hypothetical protein
MGAPVGLKVASATWARQWGWSGGDPNPIPKTPLLCKPSVGLKSNRLNSVTMDVFKAVNESISTQTQNQTRSALTQFQIEMAGFGGHMKEKGLRYAPMSLPDIRPCRMGTSPIIFETLSYALFRGVNLIRHHSGSVAEFRFRLRSHVSGSYVVRSFRFRVDSILIGTRRILILRKHFYSGLRDDTVKFDSLRPDRASSSTLTLLRA